MLVRVRISFGRVRKERGPFRRNLVAALRRWSNPASAVALAVALWRLAYDLNWTRRFVIPEGIFSHWQLWMALAVVLQIIAAALARHGRRHA